MAFFDLGLADIARVAGPCVQRAMAVALRIVFCFGIAAISFARASTPFSVVDSIEMVRLADPDLLWSNVGFRDPSFNFSPDSTAVTVVTRRGDVRTGLNEFSLILYRASDIQTFLSKPESARPIGDVLATFSSASVWPAIDQVTWLPDSRHLVFIGRRLDNVGQLYRLDTTSRQLAQLTTSTDDIMRFGVSTNGETFVYSALTIPDRSQQLAHGYAVESEYALALTWTRPEDVAPEIRYFTGARASGSVISVDSAPGDYGANVFVSPSGRLAVILAYPQGIPPGWERYEFAREQIAHAVQAGVFTAGNEGRAGFENDAFGTRIEWLPRALLVDTTNGRAIPLLDAPLVATLLSIRTRWSADSKRLVIGPTYLPLENTSRYELDRRSRLPSIAEVEIDTRRITRVVDIDRGVRVTEIEWLRTGEVVIQSAKPTGGVLPLRRFRKRNGAWQEIVTPVRARHRAVELTIVQGMNTPVEISATDTNTGASRVLTDLNPQLRRLTLARTEVFEWKDRLGRTFRGGLVVPPNVGRPARLPVVFQGSGFREDIFSTDGGSGFQAAYAAQALANQGMLVVQLPTRPSGVTWDPARQCAEWTDCGESPLWQSMFESAVDTLSDRGLIDKQRIGVIGFSRVGMYVHHLLTASQYRIAAATISDSIAATPLSYTFVYGYGLPGMLEFEDASSMGASFWGDGINRWEERSPLFHLDQLHSPLRLEFIGKGISAYWDTFAILKRHRRPVELIHIPNDVHPLQTPYGRYASLQGNVDWFCFWLQGKEDASPEKGAQYDRWKKLKKMQEAPSRSSH